MSQLLYAISHLLGVGRSRRQFAYAVAAPEAPPSRLIPDTGGGGGSPGGWGDDPERKARARRMNIITIAFVVVIALVGREVYEFFHSPDKTITNSVVKPAVHVVQTVVEKAVPKTVTVTELGPTLLGALQQLDLGSNQPFQKDLLQMSGWGGLAGKFNSHSAQYHAVGSVLVETDSTKVNLVFNDATHSLAIKLPVPVVSQATIDAVQSHIVAAGCGGIQKLKTFFHADHCSPTQSDEHQAWLDAQADFLSEAGLSATVISGAEAAAVAKETIVPLAILQHFWPDATLTVSFVPAAQLSPQITAPTVEATLPPGVTSYTPPATASDPSPNALPTVTVTLPPTSETSPPPEAIVSAPPVSIRAIGSPGPPGQAIATTLGGP